MIIFCDISQNLIGNTEMFEGIFEKQTYKEASILMTDDAISYKVYSDKIYKKVMIRLHNLKLIFFISSDDFGSYDNKYKKERILEDYSFDIPYTKSDIVTEDISSQTIKEKIFEKLNNEIIKMKIFNIIHYSDKNNYQKIPEKIMQIIKPDLNYKKKLQKENQIRINENSINYSVPTGKNIRNVLITLYYPKITIMIYPNDYYQVGEVDNYILPLKYYFNIQNDKYNDLWVNCLQIRDLKKKFLDKNITEKIFAIIKTANENNYKEIAKEIVKLIEKNKMMIQ
jgi:hypothetical protein